MTIISRTEQWSALQEEYKDLIGLPWVGRRLHGCYEIIRKYYKWKYDFDMIDFNARGTILFSDDAISEQGGEWIYRSEWGDLIDFNDLQLDDILVFRLYTTPLGGSYSVSSKHKIPNHGGVYLGDGFMLHHPYDDVSQIEDLYNPGVAVYQQACVGALRMSNENLLMST
jgi:cell wall-associated NlpC family hydrolase